MARDRMNWRDGRVILLALVLLIVVSGVILYVSDPARRHRATAATTSSTPSFPDRDHDGLPDPVPIQRLAANPEAAPVLDAIAKIGGWRAWSQEDTIRCRAEALYFNAAGAITGRGHESWQLTLQGPPRIRIDRMEDRTSSGLGPEGAWTTNSVDSDGDGTPDGTSEAAGEVRALLLQTVRVMRMPFNLGEVDVTIRAAEKTEGDSLVRVVASWPPAPGSTRSREMTLGFSAADSLLHDLAWAEEDSTEGIRAAMEMELFDWRPEAGLWIAHRRRLLDLTEPGARVVIAEQQLDAFDLHPDPGTIRFEPPANR